MNPLELFDIFVIPAKIFLATMVVSMVLWLDSGEDPAVVPTTDGEKEPHIIPSPGNGQPFFESLRYSVPIIMPIALGNYYNLPLLTIGILAALLEGVSIYMVCLKNMKKIKLIRSSE